MKIKYLSSIRLRISLLLSIIIICTLAGACSSRPSTNPSSSSNSSSQRTWFPLLGEKDPQPWKRTPKFKIQYQSNGFDVQRPKKATKGAAYLESVGAKHLVDQFLSISKEVENIPLYIDEAYEKNVLQYRNCQGKFLDFITNNDPQSIRVEVVATPEWVAGHNTWAGGLALRNKIDIKCVVVTVNGLLTNPSTSDLREFKSYIVWEIGNLLSMRYGFNPSSIESEWGDKIPCQR